MDSFLRRFPGFANPRFIAWGLAIIIVAATIPQLSRGPMAYNNFAIFRWSFHNLVSGTDLYSLHPEQHLDLFKYSPTFALLMAPFWYMPLWLSLPLWYLLNSAIFCWAIRQLSISDRQKAFVLWFVAMELFGSTQTGQSNGLMAGLIIGAFAALEDRRPIFAALLIVLGVYVKLFAAVAAALMLFYPRKIQFSIALITWTIVLALLPLLVVTPVELQNLYQSWLRLLKNDPAHNLNYSWMTLTQSWFHFTAPDSYYLAPGAVLLLAPLLRRQFWNDFAFRLIFLAALLVWVVIFNHKAESPTYVIAVCGVALWSLCERNAPLRIGMLWFVFVGTILSASDVFPKYVKVQIWAPYSLKALPCIVAWLVMTWELLRARQFELQDDHGTNDLRST